MLAVWQGCQEYYYKCISRKAQFTVAMSAPSKVTSFRQLSVFSLSQNQQLRYKLTSPCFSATFYKGGQFHDFLSASPSKHVCFKREEPRWKGRVGCLESVPIHLDKSQPVLQIRRDDRDNLGIISHTVIILNIGTDRSEQTVQTLIRLLLKEQSDQGLLCLLFCLHLLNTILHCKIQLFQL